MVPECPFEALQGPICDENSAKKRKQLFLFFKGEVLIILFRIEKWCRFFSTVQHYCVLARVAVLLIECRLFFLGNNVLLFIYARNQ